MRLLPTREGAGAGRWCPSDHGITLARLRRGWRVKVRRLPGRRAEHHAVPNLAQAIAWAKRRWRPEFLESIIRGLSPDDVAHQVHRHAVLGDTAALLALMDIAEERGLPVDRLEILRRARRERLLAANVPVTADELAEQVREARDREAGGLAKIYAEVAYKQRWSRLLGGQRFREWYLFHDHLSLLPDPHRRQRCRQVIRQRFAALGLQAVAEASFPLEGPDTGHTAVTVYWAPRCTVGRTGCLRTVGRMDLEMPMLQILYAASTDLGESPGTGG